MSRLPSLGPRGEGWLAMQLLLMGAIVAAGWVFEGALGGWARTLAAFAGLALVVSGVALVGLAARQLGAAATPLPRPHPGASMVADGVYRHVRHPIYVGVMTSALGWAVLMVSPSALVLVGVLVLLLDLKARREEAWLREHYPAYARYMRATRRFIPRLY